jgi:hypothetical protein
MQPEFFPGTVTVISSEPSTSSTNNLMTKELVRRLWN